MSPEALLKAVQGLVIHGDQGKLYDVVFSKRQTDEELLRTVPQLLGRIFEIDGSGLTASRPPQHRLIGMCRDYALLLVSFLRSRGIPARMRAGFAGYFKSGLPFEDHWVAEYYSEKQQRWLRVDAQLDAVQRAHYGIAFDTEDMPRDAGFITGGEAQRLKLAKELGGGQKKHMAFVLDEPTTGLHFQDIQKLLVIFRKLVEAGHSLYIIEHNTEVISAADWIIDVGPEGGNGGGEIVAAGSPKKIKKNPASITGRYI